MDLTEQLRAWGAAHAQARRAEQAPQNGESEDAQSFCGPRRDAKSLRERADRLHREIYGQLDRRMRDAPR